MEWTRRDFLKLLAAGAVAASAPWWLKGKARAQEAAEKPARLPRLKLVFHYGAHGSEKDAEHIGELLDRVKPHVYASEAAYLSEVDKKRFLLARKLWRVHPKEAVTGTEKFSRKEMEFLREHGVPETILELNENEQAWAIRGMSRSSFEMETLARDAFYGGMPDEALRLYKKSLALAAYASQYREASMIENARQLAEKLVEEYPELAGEKEIRVLARLGSYHTRPYNVLKRAGFDVERYFDVNPVVYKGDVELQRRTALGKAKGVGNDVYARAFLNDLFLNALPRIQDTQKRYVASRILARKMGYKDLVEFSRLAAEAKGEPVIARFLKARRIAVPESEKAVDELIRKHYPRMRFGLWHATAARRERER